MRLKCIKISTQAVLMGQQSYHFNEVPSTNLVARDLYHKNGAHGVLVVADAQTHGKGRLGREWVSPPGINLYCSYTLELSRAPHEGLWIPLIASMAVSAAIAKETGLTPGIKWPNDVLVKGRKVAGILAETVPGRAKDSVNIQAAIVGIGINVNMLAEHFPPALRETATSLAECLGVTVNRNELLESLTAELNARCLAFRQHGASAVLDEYLTRSVTVGRRVVAHMPSRDSIEGWADGIEDDGSLRLRCDLGAYEIIRSADVVHLR